MYEARAHMEQRYMKTATREISLSEHVDDARIHIMRVLYHSRLLAYIGVVRGAKVREGRKGRVTPP